MCKLKKSIYGLKQSPCCKNVGLIKHLCNIGFTQSSSDPCIYTLERGSVFLAVYVDNFILAGKSEQCMYEVKQAITNRFAVKDIGELQYSLGVTVDQEINLECIWIGLLVPLRECTIWMMLYKGCFFLCFFLVTKASG